MINKSSVHTVQAMNLRWKFSRTHSHYLILPYGEYTAIYVNTIPYSLPIL